MSCLEIVRRLCASATRNARHVTSWINTRNILSDVEMRGKQSKEGRYALSQALQNKTGANHDFNKYIIILSVYRGQLTVGSDHLPHSVSLRLPNILKRRDQKRTLTSGSLFMTFLILARGSGGCRPYGGGSFSAASTCLCQKF